jgi:hypothetical protein
VSAHGNLWIADEKTEWAWWVDEYYTFYPDGTGVRKVGWRQPKSGPEFRPAYKRTLRGTDLPLWLERTSAEPVRIEITRETG